MTHRFGIRTALIAIAAFAICFASFRLDVSRGRTLGPVVPQDISAFTIYTRDYDISDIVDSTQEAGLLLMAIHSSVDRKNWDVRGGYAVLAFDSTHNTMSASHVWTGHVDLVRYLTAVRENLAVGRDLDKVLTRASMQYTPLNDG